MSIGERIKEARKRLNLTQEEFGEIIGVTKNTVYRWEAGISVPSKKTLERFRQLGINPEWIKTGKGEIESQVVKDFKKPLEITIDVDEFEEIPEPDTIEEFYFFVRHVLKEKMHEIPHFVWDKKLLRHIKRYINMDETKISAFLDLMAYYARIKEIRFFIFKIVPMKQEDEGPSNTP